MKAIKKSKPTRIKKPPIKISLVRLFFVEESENFGTLDDDDFFVVIPVMDS